MTLDIDQAAAFLKIHPKTLQARAKAVAKNVRPISLRDCKNA